MNTEKTFWGRGILWALGVMIVFLAVQSAVAFVCVGGRILYSFLRSGGMTESVETMFSTQIIWIQIVTTLMSTVILMLWSRSLGLLPRSVWHFKGVSIGLWVGLAVFTLALAQGIGILTEYLQLPDLTQDTIQGMIRSPFGVLAIAIIGPIGEEVVFRTSLISKLQKLGWSDRHAIVLSALIFGLVHLNPPQMIFAFIFGLFLGWLFIRTKSIIPCMALHMLNNAFSVILSLCIENPEESSVDFFGPTGCLVMMIACLIIPTILYFCWFRLQVHEME